MNHVCSKPKPSSSPAAPAPSATPCCAASSHTDIGEIRIFSRDEKKQHDMRLAYGNNRKLKFSIGDVRRPESLLDAMTRRRFRLPRRRAQAGALLRVLPDGGAADQRGGHRERDERGRGGRRQAACVVLSTDKAAYPINAMGISKAMMEKLAVAKSRVAADRGCIISITRYGNVMASRGSVIPLFVEQIKAGKPLTITDPHMTRFMMSIDDAVDLVLYAFEHGQPGDLFVQKAPAATIETLAQATAAASSTRITRSKSSARGTARSSTRRC